MRKGLSLWSFIGLTRRESSRKSIPTGGQCDGTIKASNLTKELHDGFDFILIDV
jgi:hypothetical protein